jgi:hypothetical protein
VVAIRIIFYRIDKYNSTKMSSICAQAVAILIRRRRFPSDASFPASHLRSAFRILLFLGFYPWTSVVFVRVVDGTADGRRQHEAGQRLSHLKFLNFKV